MKALPLLKALVLLSAAATAILRLLLFRGAETFAAPALQAMRAASYAATAVLLLSGICWALLEKKSARARKDGQQDGEAAP